MQRAFCDTHFYGLIVQHLAIWYNLCSTFLGDCKVKVFCIEIAKYVECKCFSIFLNVINSQIRKFLCPIKKGAFMRLYISEFNFHNIAFALGE